MINTIIKRLGETMALPTKLVITGLAEEYHQAFLDMADIMELSRDQLLVLLMVGARVVDGGLNTAIPDPHAQGEWRNLMLNRIFELGNL